MRVGVLVPVHGFAPYLPETLDAILGQRSSAALEVVVVDDGSSLPIVLHPDHADRVRLVRRDAAGGPAAARAAGLAALDDGVAAVALCDADDTWLPGSVARAVDALDAEPAAGWAFGGAVVVGPGGRPTGEAWATLSPGRHAAGTFAARLYTANPIPTSSVVLRRSALDAAGGFAGPVRVAEDWELWLRLCAAGQDAVCVGAPAVRYRRHPGGLTADVARLAAAQLIVHELHADVVGLQVAAGIVADDHAALAAGLARAGDHAGASAAWAQVAAARPLQRGERLRRAALRVPLVRGRLGRTDPYRG
ncbi:hypothetical protein DSM112329_00326 [Paraconexibacter sp. AEG42_29]|uniref:Glycosyltransferase 2-like domain-containing protein n=1 Tax=Paraconexibacter sp. AEG42_29 TaxID=2997339 RepID=A0AAU7APA7_9ACTN